MKITIIMPTYNDSESICKSIDSVIEQTYSNWELIIVDDGSTDNTKDKIKKYLSLDNKIQYYYKENSDQLNAIKYVLDKISGDYVYILHSDDLLYSSDSLKNFVNFEKSNPGYDSYTGDQMLIDANGNEIKISKLMKYKQSINRLALLYLWLGRNLYIDFAFYKTSVFLTTIKESYLTWNMPYWVDLYSEPNLINVKNMDFIMFRYRVHSKNYINSDIGKLNVINGELRTATILMNYFYIPNYKFQYLLYRVFNKIKLANIFVPIYKKQREKNKGKIVKFIIKKRFKDKYKDNLFLSAIVKFYNNSNDRVVYVDKLKDNEILFLGSDIREFNLKLGKNKLPQIYYKLLSEMEKGFSTIVCSEKDVHKLENITKFLCIYPHVKITSL